MNNPLSNDSHEGGPRKHDLSIDHLIEKYFLDELSEAEKSELINALSQDRHHRDRFRSAARIDAELRHSCSGEDSGSAEVSRQLDATLGGKMTSEALADPFPSRLSWATQRGWQSLVVAAVILVVAGLVFIATDKAAAPQSLVLARLVSGFDHQFRTGFSPSNDSFGSGDYELTHGAITIQFQSGVDVSIESPARFGIVNATRIKMAAGRARAIVPEAGHGFVIETPTADIEDLGTEFGVYVDDQQETELHVFAGEVNLRSLTQPSQHLYEDMAVRLTSAGTEHLARTDDVAFTTSGTIGYQRWLADSQVRRSDPSTVLYYDFERDLSRPQSLRDVSETEPAINGDVQGCFWATGRWPNKGALLLEHLGDRVELDVPGKFDALTISGWLQINRFDSALQCFLNTRDWQRGEHHWNILRDGVMRTGVSGAYALTAYRKRIPLGRWTHLVASLDRNHQTASYFLDGENVGQIAWDSKAPIVFGPCTIGAFGTTQQTPESSGNVSVENPPSKVTYDRELRGRIDELAIFRRAFSAAEVKELYEAGSGFQ
ncbi:FecR family protein [Neorhodopirellula lusitana]|uniref:FecR family protein n=1 Tax=Neorhodopirellula lusitana TaxID=445327 RepID=A0ABY1Q4M4_9BACT|nr:LamG-like jellyroll fold domain-containing protein [Neorhodopirellula lusitana]SMP58236.1 FecR family protein [Neorhodopirellula lusitana]